MGSRNRLFPIAIYIVIILLFANLYEIINFLFNPVITDSDKEHLLISGVTNVVCIIAFLVILIYGKKLAKSEEWHRSILQTAMDGLVRVDRQGRFLEVNEAYCRMSGYSARELLTMGIPDLEPAETTDETVTNYNKIMSLGEHRFETLQRRKDGTIYHVEVSAQPQLNEGGQLLVFLRDITDRKRAEEYRELGREILQILNEPGELQDSIQKVLAALKRRTGFDAAGIRLQKGDDFPYVIQEGFSDDFLLTENTLIERAADGGMCRDTEGNVRLECTCGLVISGKTDPANPLFTPGGSFWTNDSIQILDIPPGEDPRRHPRNKCIHQGYGSVALVPIRNNDGIVGLIQLNDRRNGRFTLEMVELMEGVASHIGEALMRKRMEEALKESENRFRELSIVDDLTQLYNSRHFYHQLKIESDRSNRYGQPLTLLLLDIDDFKRFNDTYGHIEGDHVLRRLGQVVKRYLRQTDSAYRYGGEEFTILLPMTASADGAITAERIRTEFKKESFSPRPGRDIHLTVSVGVAQYKPKEEMKTFIHRVDQLMYQGKKNGKDRVCSEQ